MKSGMRGHMSQEWDVRCRPSMKDWDWQRVKCLECYKSYKSSAAPLCETNATTWGKSWQG